jgi:hypothetical protein
VRIDAVSANARSGSKAVQMYGRFSGAMNNSGLFQEVPASEGEIWQIGAWSKNRDGDALQGANTAHIKVEFLNGSGTILDVATLKVADAGSPAAYRESVLRRAAPTGTVFARAVLEMVQSANAGGAVNFDDVTLRRALPGAFDGDVNLDGTVDALDLDALMHSLSSANGAFDFDGNAMVNQRDVDVLLTSAFGTVRGDANLDQHVDFDDLLILAQNYGRAGTGAWSIGDFNGDSSVGFDDLLALAQNYGPTALAIGQVEALGSFHPVWSSARALVPEPTCALASAALLACPRKRRHVSSPRRRVQVENGLCESDSGGPKTPSQSVAQE